MTARLSSRSSHLQANQRHGSGQGFTLLEVLVALVIMAVIAVLSWQGLGNVIRLTDRIREIDNTTADWRAIFGQLEADFKQVPLIRTPLTALQVKQNPVIVLDEGGLAMLVRDQIGQERAQWAQIRWGISNNRLYRASQPVQASKTDADKPLGGSSAIASEPAGSRRLDGPGLRGMRIRFWVDGSGWSSAQTYGQAIPDLNANANVSADNQLIAPALLDSAVITSEGATSGNTAGNVTSGSSPSTANGFNAPTGIEVRVWLLDGRIYTRVFRMGSAA